MKQLLLRCTMYPWDPSPNIYLGMVQNTLTFLKAAKVPGTEWLKRKSAVSQGFHTEYFSPHV